MVHEELLSESKLWWHFPESILIFVVFGDSLDAFPDKLSISSLLNQLALDVIMEESECLGVVFAKNFSTLVLIILHEYQARDHSKVCHELCQGIQRYQVVVLSASRTLMCNVLF